jgi:hypothetical protein
MFGAKVSCCLCIFFFFFVFFSTFFSIKHRYRNITQLVAFEQNHLACFSQFLTGFLVPVQTYLKRQTESDQMVLKSDQVTAFADALYAAYVRHASVLEKLDNQTQTYPFCIETGAILDSEQSLGQLYLLLLDFIPLLVDWSYSVLDGVRSVFFEKVEADQGLRLDHGSCRLLLWGIMRYWQQVRLPTIQILGFTPSETGNETALLCAAVTRMSFLDGSIRLSTEVSSARLRLYHLMQRYAPGSVATLDKKYFTDSGKLEFDEACQLKSKGKSTTPVRVIGTSMYLFILSDSGNPKKDKVVDILPNRSISEVLLQPDQKEVLVQSLSSEYGASAPTEKKKLGSSSSGSIPTMTTRAMVFLFEVGRKAVVFQTDLERLANIARNGVTHKKFEAQVEELKRFLPSSACALPEFPVLLVQHLSLSSDEALSKVFSLTSNELKVFFFFFFFFFFLV